MKLHLPHQLFKAVLALMLAAPTALYAAYTAPTSITSPTGYGKSSATSADTIDLFRTNSQNRAFFFTTDVTFNKPDLPLMTHKAGSWYFTSNGVKSLRSLSFYKGTSLLFNLNEDKYLSFKALNSVLFERNSYALLSYDKSSTTCGSTIKVGEDATVNLTNIATLTFDRNSASHTSVSSTTFQNSASTHGGAVFGDIDSTINIHGNRDVSFIGNSAYAQASADAAYPIAAARGGAIYGATINITGNDSVLFSGNSATAEYSAYAYAYGGAIYGTDITLSNNGTIEFSANTIKANRSTAYTSGYNVALGSAIYVAEDGSLTISNNKSVSLKENSDSYAICTGGGSSITITGNDSFSLDTGISVGGSDSTISVSSNKMVNIASITASHYDCSITFTKNTTVNFIRDTSSSISRSAIYGSDDSTITLSDNGSVTFSKNGVHISRSGGYFTSAYAYGGAIRGDAGSAISLNNNERLLFNENSASSYASSYSTNTTSYNSYAYSYGGAIYGNSITLNNNDSVTFSGNKNTSSAASYYYSSSSYYASSGSSYSRTYSYGGAICGSEDSTITLSDNGSVTFSGNSVSSTLASYGGAIYGDTITLSDNGSVTFSGNSASSSDYSSGGAIYGDTITLSDNGSVTFSGNSASSSDYSYGGAIYGDTITLSDNGSVTFSGNSASSSSDYSYGGAIYGETITLSDNGSVTFKGNSASSTLSKGSYGGAIYGNTGSVITLSDNGSVTFSGNSASASPYLTTATAYYDSYGGAIKGDTITLSNNGSVTFKGNSVSSSSDSSSKSTAPYSYGGAIYGDTITLSDNGSVTFSGNSASSASSSFYNSAPSLGGAIYTRGNLSIRNNGTTLFEKNAEIKGGSYRLRSIYADGDENVISLSAAEGKVIEFRDSVYIGSGNTIKLNEAYTDAAGKVYKQEGDIIFTGAYTERHLNELLSANEEDRTATDAEISYSRTSELYGDVTLYGGRLRVEDGAIFSGNNFATMTGSGAVLRLHNGQFSMSGSATINSGTSLELSGSNTISGNLNFASGSTLVLLPSTQNKTNALLTGTFELNSGAKISVPLRAGCADEVFYLICDNLEAQPAWMSNWRNSLEVEGSWDSYLTYRDNAVYLYYDLLRCDWQNMTGNRRWDTVSVNWRDGSADAIFFGESLVSFGNTGAGNVQLVGSLAPRSVTVTNYAGYDYTWHGQGRLVGSMSLTKKGHGNLTINTANTYTGGTDIYAGTVKTGTATALGTGKVNLYGGTLHLNKQAVANTITLSGAATIYGSSFKGNFSMSSGTLSADSYLGIISGKTATIKGGTIKGTITGAGSTAIAGKVNLTDGSITTNKLTIYSGNKLSVTTTKGLNGRAIQMGTGGKLSSVGQVAASSLTMSGDSSLLVNGTSPRGLIISGATSLTDSAISVKGTLSGGTATLNNSSFTQKTSTTGVKLSGKFAMEGGSKAALAGALSASNLSMKGGSMLTVSGAAAREVNLADTAYISYSGMNLNGYLVAKNLTLNKGRLYQHHSTKGIKITNKLTMGSGSTLSTGAALSLNSAAISGGTINMTSSTIQRINVTYTFNLTGAMDLNLGCNLTKGSTYKLITYGKTNLTSTSNLAKLLGMTGAGCKLIFNPKYIAIQVTDSTAWSKYIAANKTAFSNAYKSVTTGATPQAVTSAVQAPEIMENTAEAAPGTDLTLHTALVQSSWGTVHASRAFVDALSNRMQNATTLGESKSTAAWLSVLGGAGRISWDGAYAGSDYHLTGAAFGMQQQLTPRSTMGLAIGNSWGKVSAFGAPAIDQDTTHIALYGDSTLLQREKDALTLSWSAAYGRSDSDMTLNGINSEWEQKALQLNARATYGYALSERSTLSGFAGLEYLTTDSGDIAPGATSGSVQNLRGEIGVSLGHKFSDRSSMYAELSFVGDMVRNNPTAEVGGVRSKGSNPGRAGINFSVAGSHALNENWSVNAAYNLELMQHSNSHSANIGLSRKF